MLVSLNFSLLFILKMKKTKYFLFGLRQCSISFMVENVYKKIIGEVKMLLSKASSFIRTVNFHVNINKDRGEDEMSSSVMKLI